MSVRVKIFDDLVVTSKETVRQLLRCGQPDAMTLYFFYLETAGRQQTDKPRATETYCMRGLGWGRDKFRKAKKVLKDMKLVRDIRRQDEEGKYIRGQSYVEIDYIRPDPPETATETLPPDFPVDRIETPEIADPEPETLPTEKPVDRQTPNEPTDWETSRLKSPYVGENQALKFLNKDKNNIKLLNDDNENARARGKPAAVVSDLVVGLSEAAAALRNVGIGDDEAGELLQRHGAQRCFLECDKAHWVAERGKLKGSKSGFVTKSLQTPDGFSMPEGYADPWQRIEVEAKAEAKVKEDRVKAEAEAAEMARRQADRKKWDDVWDGLHVAEQEAVANAVLQRFAAASALNAETLVPKWQKKYGSSLAILREIRWLAEWRDKVLAERSKEVFFGT